MGSTYNKICLLLSVMVDNFRSIRRNGFSKIVHWTIKVVDRIMYLVDNIHYCHNCLDNLKACVRTYIITVN